MLCYFIEFAFIHILKAFIRKTTGEERRLLKMGGGVPAAATATTTTSKTFTPSEELTWWGLQKGRAHFVGRPHPLQEEAELIPCSCPWMEPHRAA